MAAEQILMAFAAISRKTMVFQNLAGSPRSRAVCAPFQRNTSMAHEAKMTIVPVINVKRPNSPTLCHQRCFGYFFHGFGHGGCDILLMGGFQYSRFGFCIGVRQ